MKRESFLSIADLKQIARLGIVTAVLVFLLGVLASLGAAWRYINIDPTSAYRIKFDLFLPVSQVELHFYNDLMNDLTKGNLPVSNVSYSDGIVVVEIPMSPNNYDPVVRTLRESFGEAHRAAVQQMARELDSIQRRAPLVQQFIRQIEGEGTPAEVLSFLKDKSREMEADRRRLIDELAGARPPELFRIEEGVGKLSKSRILSALIVALLSGLCAGFLVGYGRLYVKREGSEREGDSCPHN